MKLYVGYKLKLYRDNVDSLINGIKDRLNNADPVNITTQNSNHAYDTHSNVVEALPREQFLQRKLEVLQQGAENLKTILSLTPPVKVEKVDVSTRSQGVGTVNSGGSRIPLGNSKFREKIII